MSDDILCVEIDELEKTGGAPIWPEGPMSLFGRTGRWAFIHAEDVDRLKCPDATRAAIRAARKAFLLSDVFEDFFGKDKEVTRDQNHDVRLPKSTHT